MKLNGTNWSFMKLLLFHHVSEGSVGVCVLLGNTVATSNHLIIFVVVFFSSARQDKMYIDDEEV